MESFSVSPILDQEFLCLVLPGSNDRVGPRKSSKLFATGFDFESISREIFSNQEIEKVILKSTSLSNLELHGEKKVCGSALAFFASNRWKTSL